METSIAETTLVNLRGELSREIEAIDRALEALRQTVDEPQPKKLQQQKPQQSRKNGAKSRGNVSEDTYNRVLAVMQEHTGDGSDITAHRVSELVGLGGSTVRAALHQMRKEGMILKVGYGDKTNGVGRDPSVYRVKQVASA